MNKIFTPDFETQKELKYLEHARIQNAKTISSNVSEDKIDKPEAIVKLVKEDADDTIEETTTTI